MQMKIVAFVIGIIFTFTIAVYISFYFYFKFIESSEYVDFLTDLIFTCIGFLCPYLNFSMRSKYPDVFYKNDLEGNSINTIYYNIYSLLFHVKDLHRRSYYFLFCAVDWSIQLVSFVIQFKMLLKEKTLLLLQASGSLQHFYTVQFKFQCSQNYSSLAVVFLPAQKIRSMSTAKYWETKIRILWNF